MLTDTGDIVKVLGIFFQYFLEFEALGIVVCITL